MSAPMDRTAVIDMVVSVARDVLRMGSVLDDVGSLIQAVQQLGVQVGVRQHARELPAMRAKATCIATMALRLALDLGDADTKAPGHAIRPAALTLTPKGERDVVAGGGAVCRPSLTTDQAPALRTKTWSPERNAIVARDWPTERQTCEILAEVNALPGNPVSVKMVACRAHYLRVSRPAGARGTRSPSVSASASASVPLPGPAPAVSTNLQSVAQWGAERGLTLDGSDIGPINDRRRSLGLPPFQIELPAHLRLAAERAA